MTPAFDSASLSSAGTRQLPSAWALASAEIVEHLDAPKLPELLANGLGTLLPFENCIQFVYSQDAAPINLFEGTFRRSHAAGFQNYISKTYAIDPFYQRYRSGIHPGAYRMRDLASDMLDQDEYLPAYPVVRRESEEIGYLTRGWPSSREEVSIALSLPDHRCAEISLSRPWSEKGFSQQELEGLALVVPFLQAAIHRYWKAVGGQIVQRSPLRANAHQKETDRFAELSPRESEVVGLLLRGHSTLSISLHLGISPTTVKTHRKNSYAKLGIATQYELYALSLQTL